VEERCEPLIGEVSIFNIHEKRIAIKIFTIEL